MGFFLPTPKMIKNSIKLDKSSKITWQLSFVSIMGRKHV
jgi:hypothetical protein